ncbi:MAG: ATP synthase F0 subunit B [Deltaproteobacteria bacterium]|nr:ATP synthase F0 subunit B [Deltaproteobacteria bacterium]
MSRLKRWLRAALGSSGGRRVLSGLTLATSCLVATLALAASPEGHGDPHVNWWTWDKHAPPVGWYLVDFLLFVGMLVYVARKPIREAFAQRHLTIKQAIEDTQRAHAEVSRRYQNYRDKLANIDDETALLVRRAREDGALERDQIANEARTYAERLRGEVQSIAEQEVTKARQRLQRETAQRLIASVEAALRRQVGAAEHKDLIEAAIVELEKEGAPTPRRREAHSRPSAGGAA